MPNESWQTQAARRNYPMTQANIDAALRAEMQNCPIALALKDGGLNALVNSGLIIVHQPGCSCVQYEEAGPVPERQKRWQANCGPLLLLPSGGVADFTDAFDNEQFVTPASLRIVLRPATHNEPAHGALRFEGEK